MIKTDAPIKTFNGPSGSVWHVVVDMGSNILPMTMLFDIKTDRLMIYPYSVTEMLDYDDQIDLDWGLGRYAFGKLSSYKLFSSNVDKNKLFLTSIDTDNREIRKIDSLHRPGYSFGICNAFALKAKEYFNLNMKIWQFGENGFIF